MGYGKSALVSNILCSNDELSGKNIREMVISYHICRYDTISTQNPAYFIRNLAGNIINKLPEYGQNIRKDNLAMRYLSSEMKCSEDPIGCIDFGIIHPLMETTSNSSKYVIIDALDECIKSDVRKVSIVSILQSRIHKLPKWIKFLITSRTDDNFIRGFSQLKQINLSSQKSENIEDIKEYIKSTLVRPVWYSHIPGTQSYTDHENIATMLLNKSRGNFLFVATILEHWSRFEFPLIHEIPTSLRQVYEHNFRRSLGKIPFSKVKSLLEVLVSSTRDMSESELFTIAQIKSTRKRETCLKILKPFVTRTKNRISLAHPIIAEIFSDIKHNSDFYISKQHGHFMFAEYYLHVQRQWNLNNIADIVLHVSESKDRRIEKEFLKKLKESGLNKESLTKHGETLLHHLVRYVDSYNAVKLILSSIKINKNDYRNHGNVSAEFLAAAFGHSKSLEYMLDKQTGTTFTIKPARKMLHDGVNFCKFIGLCGYNMLHVAAQFGHDSVVQLLLFRDKSLIYKNNSIGLNAFQLAAEQGHFHILDRIDRIDKGFADLHSLYHASKNGHVDVVKFLLKRKVRDQCLPCNGSFYWVKGTIRAQASAFQYAMDLENMAIWPNTIIPTGELSDDWRLLTCKTALEISTENGHIEVVKLLLDSIPNGLFCRQYSGLTPVLSAVYHSQLDILKILIAKGGLITDQCTKKQYVSSRWHEMLDKSERDKYMAVNCPEGATIAHLCAIYNTIDIAHYIYNIGYKEWEKKDSFGISPAHYAASHGSVEFLDFLANDVNLDVIRVTTNNGSTPIHSAAMYDRLFSLEWFYKANVHMLLDNNGNGILHYALMQRYDDDVLAKYAENTNKMMSVSLIIEKQKHLLEIANNDGKTAFHYIAINGIFDCIDMLLNSLTKEKRRQFLLIKDRDGNDILELAFSNLFPKNYKIYPFQMTKCPLIKIYKNSCDFHYDLRNILSAYELTIVKYLKYIHDLEIIHLYNITKHIETAVNKRNFYVLTALKVYASNVFDLIINTQPTRLINIYLATEGGPEIAELLLPAQMFRCGKILHENPIHNIVMNNENKFWYHSPSLSDTFLKHALGTKNASFLNHCLDSEGFNILHRAIIGGHVAAVKYLIYKVGMKLTIKTKNEHNILLKTVEQSTNIVLKKETDFYLVETQDRQHIKYINEISNTKNYEGMVSFLLLNDKNLHIPVKALCNEEKGISLIHIAAAKGLISLLEYSFSKYGINVLKCENIHRFTPLYFAKVFNQEKTIEFLQNKELFVIYPSFVVEMNFILKLLHRFEIPFAAESAFWKCKRLKTYPINARLIHKYFKCMYGLTQELFRLRKFSGVHVKGVLDSQIVKYIKSFSSYSRLHCYTDEHNYFLYNEREYVRICLLANRGRCKQSQRECNEDLEMYCKWRYHDKDTYKFELRLIRGRNIKNLKYFLRELQQMVMKSSIDLFDILTTFKQSFGTVFENKFYRSRYDVYQKCSKIITNKSGDVLKHISSKIIKSFIHREFKYLEYFKNFGFNLINSTDVPLKEVHMKSLRLLRMVMDFKYNITKEIGASDIPLKQPKG